MKLAVITSVFCFFFNFAFSQNGKAIFIVHSTGTNLYSQGKVSVWLNNYNTIHGTKYQITTRAFPNTPWPWDNYPYDYWKLWVNNSCDNNDLDIECLPSIANEYDLVIFKHCYPGAGIAVDNGKPDVTSKIKTLDNYKLQYRELRNLMDGMPDKKFMVWTLVPLHRLATNSATAARANEFVNWVINEWLTEDGKSHPNIFIFDFYSLAAEMNKNPANGQQYCLKYDYEYSHTSDDSHPNTIANQTIGPIFAQAVIDVLAKNYSVTNISVSSLSGLNAISTFHGTLQLQSTILPTDALTKSVTWSVVNQTGKASVNSSGLLNAEANGTVKVIATAIDGSGISGELLITISNQVVPIESITVSSYSGNQITVDNGTLQLQAELIPSDATTKTLIWTVQNESGKASIDPTGLLTAEQNGTVTAVATANDGSEIKGELQITISNQIIPIENLEIIDNLGNDTINGLSAKINLKVSIYPLDATNQKINWSVENITGQANIDSNGTLTPLSPGQIMVTAKATDQSDLSCQKDYQIVIPVGIFKNLDSQGIKIFPNPTSGKISIQLDQVPDDGAVIEIRNTMGQMLIDSRTFNKLTDYEIKDNNTEYYTVTIRLKNKIFTQKILYLSQQK